MSNNTVAARRTRTESATIFAILVAALAARLYGLASESLWLDEATSIFLAKMPIAEMVQWTAVDIHPPFYYALLHFWLVLGDGEAEVRLLSALSGVASVAVLYALARRLFNPVVGLVAAALLAVSPLHVWYSQETRMYALLALLGLLTAYLMVLALLDQRRGAWPAYGICAMLTLYTHYYGFFILLAENLIVLFLLWRGLIERAALRRWLALDVVIALAFLPWLPTLVRQVQSGGGGWVARGGLPGLRAIADTFISFSLGPDLRWYPPLLRRLAYVAYAALLVLGSAYPLYRRSRTTAGVVFCLVYLLVPLGTAWAVSQVKPLYSLRYLLPFLPAYYILIGQGADIVRTWAGGANVPLAGRRLAASLWGIVVAGLLLINVAGIEGAANHQQVTDWRGIARYVTSRAGVQDVVLFVPGWNSKPFDYYARGSIATNGNTPIPVPPGDIPRLIAEAGAGRSRLWLVQAEGHYADPTNAVTTYMDASYPTLDRQRYKDNIVVSLYQLTP